MKKNVIILISLFSLFSFTNYNKNKSFIGDWVWKEDNKTFKVHLYSQNNMLKGDYSLMKTVEGIETVMYKSNRVIDTVFNISFGYAIAGNSKDGKEFHAIIKDNVLLGDGIHGVKEGALNFTLLSKNKATWKIVPLKTNDKKSKKEPENFSVPIDIVLAKVN